MQALVTRTMASVGSTREGSGTCSTRTSPAAYIRVARMHPGKHRTRGSEGPCEGHPPRNPRGWTSADAPGVGDGQEAPPPPAEVPSPEVASPKVTPPQVAAAEVPPA